jgi:bifunctional UDP-N-acetylglucosamine pyrophosphorylase/glucosamine-1-phosphate N-acetyltransferase
MNAAHPGATLSSCYNLPMPRKKPKAAHRAESQDSPLSIVILAAGQGKRMLSDLPKVLQPLAGVPLLAHVVELAESLNPAAIHVVYGHGGEHVRAAFKQRRLQWAHQREQLGTGHAVAQAMSAIPDSHRVLVLYGDVPLLRSETLRELIDSSNGYDLSLLTARFADPTGYGRIVRASNGKPQRIVEQADTTATQRRIQEINTGVVIAGARQLKLWLAALRPRNARGEYYLTDILALAVKQRRRVATVQAADIAEVQGINDRQQLADAEAAYRCRRARALMAQGVTLIDPARVDLRGPITVGRDVQLDVNVVIEGPVTLGDRVRIGPNTVVSNVSIGAGTIVLANCVMQDAQIGKNCRIGPYTRVRPKSQVSDDVHLGNFVEIKASDIGVGSKINHLTYVGDSVVGSAVNIGAGTVTCNYDGVNKWTTHIGDGAFIGSGSMLVAPVKIGEHATIGAGSTISSDAPAEKLTLARSRQTTIEQWQRPRKATTKP